SVLAHVSHLPRGRQGPPLPQANAIELIVGRHVGQHHLVANPESGQYFDGVYRALSELHLRALGVAVLGDLEEADDALLLAESWTANIDHVVQPLELDGPVHAQIRPRALRQRAVHRDIDRDSAVLHRWIDADHVAVNDAVACVDLRLLADRDVLGLRLSDLQLGLQPLLIRDA